MSRLHVVGVLAVLVAFPALARAQTPTARQMAEISGIPWNDGFPETSTDRIFELDEVRPGQKGVGFTVFQGGRLEPFDAVVLGVMEDMLGPGGAIILARLEGEQIGFTGVIAGMSGSPVYIDGRLVGAVSYRFGSFAKQPIAGITPIRAMLDADSSSARTRAVSPGQDRRVTAPISTGGLGPDDLHGRDPSWLELPTLAHLPNGAHPIGNPISVSGIRGPALEQLASRLEGAFGPVSSGLGGRLKSDSVVDNQDAQAGRVVAPRIAPGGPVAALLMKGDMQVASIGTVTFVDSDRVLAFGHPFVGFGQVAFPMATAAILNTLASDAGSYKQGTPALEVGAIRDDRLTAIAGRLGDAARMIPVQVSVRLPGGSERVQVQIVDEPTYLPVMTEVVISSALGGRIDLEVGGTVDLKARWTVSGKTVEVQDRYAAPPPFPVSALAARDVAILTAILARNDLETPNFEGIEVEIDVRPQVDELEVVELELDRHVVHPGQMLTARTVLQGYRGERQTRTIQIPVPAWAEGRVDLVVGGGYEMDGYLNHRERPSNLEELMAIIAERRPGDRLYAAIVGESPGVQRDGERYEVAPASLRAVLDAASADRLRRFDRATGPVVEFPSRSALGGLRTVSLRVES